MKKQVPPKETEYNPKEDFRGKFQEKKSKQSEASKRRERLRELQEDRDWL